MSPNVLQYILGVREKLKSCQELAEKTAKLARSKSKVWYDKKARERSYEPGQLVLACLPIPGHTFDAKYCGPYRIIQRLGPVDYLLSTPDRRKTQRICHINMLKPYIVRDNRFVLSQIADICVTSVSNGSNVMSDPHENDFGPCASDVETNFVLDHLEPNRRDELSKLLSSFSDVFNDKTGKNKFVFASH